MVTAHIPLNLKPGTRQVFHRVTWNEYEQLLTKLGDSHQYRLTYLDGDLEIMAPSRKHEVTAEGINRLLEEYFDLLDIEYFALGSTTFRKHSSGKEPDKSYCLGEEKEFPDLAVEVIVTSGDKEKILQIYQRLGVKEVWFWVLEQFEIYCLNGSSYQQISRSQLLPDLDLKLVAQYASEPNALRAKREFRKAILNQRTSPSESLGNRGGNTVD